MRSTFSVIYFLRRDRQKKNGNAPIHCRLTINGDEIPFSIRKEVNPNLWDKNCYRVVGKTPEAINLNNYLHNFSRLCNDKYEELFLKGK